MGTEAFSSSPATDLGEEVVEFGLTWRWWSLDRGGDGGLRTEVEEGPVGGPVAWHRVHSQAEAGGGGLVGIAPIPGHTGCRCRCRCRCRYRCRYRIM